MSGADPLWLSAAFILEEGLAIADLAAIVARMAAAARTAGVTIVTGDTKVVERGRGDGLTITTAGIGVVPAGVDLGPHRIRPGDAVIVSGTLADHGMAIMSVREGLGFEAAITSDTAPLHRLVAAMLAACVSARSPSRRPAPYAPTPAYVRTARPAPSNHPCFPAVPRCIRTHAHSCGNSAAGDRTVKKPDTAPKLRTPGVLAEDLGQPLHRVLYVLRSRQQIRPTARAGRLRLFDREAVEAIRVELARMDARRGSKGVNRGN